MVHSDFSDIAEAPAISMTLHYLPVLKRCAMSGCFEIASTATETLLHSLSQLAGTGLRRIAAFGHCTLMNSSSLIASVLARIMFLSFLLYILHCVVRCSGYCSVICSVSVLVSGCEHLLCSTLGNGCTVLSVKIPFPDRHFSASPNQLLMEKHTAACS